MTDRQSAYYDPYHQPPYHPYHYGAPPHPHPQYLPHHHPLASYDAKPAAYPSPVSHDPHASPEVEIISERKRRRDDKDEVEEKVMKPTEKEDLTSSTYIDDPLYLRQQILDNAQALTQTLCPTAYGPHNMGRYSVILLQSRKKLFKLEGEKTTKERWRAGVACDGMLVVEGPEADCKSQAMNVLLDTMARRLAKCIPRAWVVEGSDDGEDATGVEEDASGARFATESSR